MAMSWAAVCKKANGGKHNGINLNAALRAKIARYNKVLAAIQVEINAIKNKANPLSVLPWELRRYVLDLIIDPIASALYKVNGRTGYVSSFPMPSIAKAFNLQNRLESILVLLEKSTLEIHSGPGLTKTMGFLQSIDFTETHKNTSYNLGFDAVKSLRFSFFSRFPHEMLGEKAVNKDVMLMRMCKNLTSVRLAFVDEEVVDCDDGDGYPAKPIEQIRREYRLDYMLDLKSLKDLHLGSSSTSEVYGQCGDIGYRQVCALKAWFDAEFVKRGRTVNVTVS